jgi:hypothetical protein
MLYTFPKRPLSAEKRTNREQRSPPPGAGSTSGKLKITPYRQISTPGLKGIGDIFIIYYYTNYLHIKTLENKRFLKTDF